MDAPIVHFELLMDLEARHDDLLVRLAELDKRVEEVLAECLAVRQAGEVIPSGGPACRTC